MLHRPSHLAPCSRPALADALTAPRVIVAIFVALMLPALLALGCSGAQKPLATRAAATVGTTLAAVEAAQTGFLAWDEAHQLEIAERAASADEYQRQITAYRAKRVKVIAAFTAAYSAVAAAAALLPLAEEGRSEVELVAALVAVAQAAADIERAIAEIRGT